MRSFLREKPLTLSEAAKIFPGRPHVNTLRRWHHKGYRGTKLRGFYSGGALCTTEAAIEEFWAALNPSAEQEAVSTPAHEAAESKLDSLGV